MNIWKMKVPGLLCSGQGTINNLKELIPKNVHNIFLVIDKNVEQGNFGEKVLKELENYKVFSFNDFTSDPEQDQIIVASEHYKKFKPQCIIAVGGGSTIDAAKCIALMGENYSNINKCFEKGNCEEKFPYFIAIPTTCGTGAESSPYAIIKDKNIPKKKAIERELFIPQGVILDPDSISTLSREYKAATALDTLVHILEVHTSTTANKLVRVNTVGYLFSFGKSFEGAIFKNKKEDLEELQCIAFTARLLYPRTGLSIAHSLAHPLGAYTRVHHGMLVAMLMPEVIRYNKEFNNEYFKEAARLLINSEEPEDIAIWIEEILERTGIYEIVKKQLVRGKIPIDDICEQAMKSSNIKSNAREIKCKKELVYVLNKALDKMGI